MISYLDYNQGRPGQSRRPADERTAARKADMLAQAAWLLERAVAEGYRSLDELVRRNSDRFAALGSEWRLAHPARF
jgi:hypothetical protein